MDPDVQTHKDLHTASMPLNPRASAFYLYPNPTGWCHIVSRKQLPGGKKLIRWYQVSCRFYPRSQTSSDLDRRDGELRGCGAGTGGGGGLDF